jgi:glycogen debranching enzyme
MDTSLSSLVHVYRDLLDSVDENGELPIEFAGAEMAVQSKALAVAAYIQQAEAEAEMVMKHGQRLQERARAAKTRALWLRKYLADAMVATGIQDLAAADLSVQARVWPDRDESVEIAPTAVLPPELMRTRIVQEPDKIAIRQAILNGQPLPEGVRLRRSHRLQIK